MLRLLLLETTSAFVERLAAALSSDNVAVCERMSLKAFEQSMSDGGVSAYDAVVLDLRQQHHEVRATCRRVFSRLKNRPLIAVTSLDRRRRGGATGRGGCRRGLPAERMRYGFSR